MNRTGHKGRVDLNHAEIINGLRQAGICAHSIASVGGGVPDILVGYRGICMALEVKRRGEQLTKPELEFATSWAGPYRVVLDPEDAVKTVLNHARDCGKL